MILSFQSHVVYGCVGNRSAAFALQRLGFEVSIINTVQFSNHTGYPTFSGQAFSADHIQDLVNGLENLGVLTKHQGILSGYLGNEELGKVIVDAVKKIKKANPAALYCCDPVMGDADIGLFAKPEIPGLFKSMLPHIDILTPNQFELSVLTKHPLATLSDIQKAGREILKKGPKIVLVTSVLIPEIPPDHIGMLAMSEQEFWLISTPRFTFKHPSSGAGDATAALFLGHYLKTHSIQTALENTASGIYALFKKTHEAGTRELQLIQAQDEIVNPLDHFQAKHL